MQDLLDHGEARKKQEEAEFARIDAEAKDERDKQSGFRGKVCLLDIAKSRVTNMLVDPRCSGWSRRPTGRVDPRWSQGRGKAPSDPQRLEIEPTSDALRSRNYGVVKPRRMQSGRKTSGTRSWMFSQGAKESNRKKRRLRKTGLRTRLVVIPPIRLSSLLRFPGQRDGRRR